MSESHFQLGGKCPFILFSLGGKCPGGQTSGDRGLDNFDCKVSLWTINVECSW